MIIIHKFSCLKKIIRIAYRDTNVFSHASALIVWEISYQPLSKNQFSYINTNQYNIHLFKLQLYKL
jgi:hypothetical protein